jgi:hypothetical protein
VDSWSRGRRVSRVSDRFHELVRDLAAYRAGRPIEPAHAWMHHTELRLLRHGLRMAAPIGGEDGLSLVA